MDKEMEEIEKKIEERSFLISEIEDYSFYSRRQICYWITRGLSEKRIFLQAYKKGRTYFVKGKDLKLFLEKTGMMELWKEICSQYDEKMSQPK